jgi:hypothetical protein
MEATTTTNTTANTIPRSLPVELFLPVILPNMIQFRYVCQLICLKIRDGRMDGTNWCILTNLGTILAVSPPA